MKVLGIGTGSGCHAHITAALIAPGKLYTMERCKDLLEFAQVKHQKLHSVSKQNPALKTLLKKINIEFIYDDGSEGYKKKAPFDCIYFTAGFSETLSEEKENHPLHQLNDKGILLYPRRSGPLRIIRKRGEVVTRKDVGYFHFVAIKEGTI